MWTHSNDTNVEMQKKTGDDIVDGANEIEEKFEREQQKQNLTMEFEREQQKHETKGKLEAAVQTLERFGNSEEITDESDISNAPS